MQLEKETELISRSDDIKTESSKHCPDCGNELIDFEKFFGDNILPYHLEGDYFCKPCKLRISVDVLEVQK